MSSVKKIITIFLAMLFIGIQVMCLSSEAYAEGRVIGTGTVTSSKVYVRKGPGKEYDDIAFVYEGDRLNILEVEDDWLKIEYANTEAYVSAQYVSYEIEEIPEESEEIVDDEIGGTEAIDMSEVEDEPQTNYVALFGTGAAIIVLIIIILFTIRSISKSDDEDYEDDYYYEGDDYYEEDEEYYEEGDYYEGNNYNAYDVNANMYGDPRRNVPVQTYEDDDYEYEYVVVKKPKKSGKTYAGSDDYSIDIDPRYFE